MSLKNNRSSPTPPRTSPAWRPNLGRTARRGIRQAAAIARKEEFHSFRVHADNTVTWTLRHEKPMPGKPKQHDGEGGDSRKREPSKRALRSRARAAAHNELEEKARRLRAIFIMRWWARASSPPPPTLQQHEQQRMEHEGAEGVMKRRAPAAPADGSPSASHRDKREHVLHPPSPTSSSGAAPSAQADAGAGGHALHTQERADAGSVGADVEGRRRAHAPSMPAIVCADAHSPGGGAAHRSQPPLAWVPAHAAPTQGSSGPPPHMECAAAHQLHAQQMIAHMRAHEYPQFMSHHMQQGMSRQEAHDRYMQYERYKVAGGRA